MNRKYLIWFSAAAVFIFSTVNAEVKVTPVANVSIMGGQYWMTDYMPTSLAGNANVFFSPAINFSQASALLPIYVGSYRGTKDVRELVGGGTLTQESQDHSLSLKYINKVSPVFKLKGRAGYKIEYLKETKDEVWGKGLFDYKKIIAGVEGERLWENINLRVGLDYYTMVYPNYQSLVTEGTFQTSIDTTTYSEISTQAGKNVLDYNGVSLVVESVKRLSKNVNINAKYDLSMKNFVDQRIVQKTGEFSSTLRSDYVHYLVLGLNLEAPRTVLSISDSVQYYVSNQNSFDAANSNYTEKHYNFIQNAVSPSVTFMLGQGEKPAKLSLIWDISYRVYSDRLAQNADASYKDSKVSQLINTTGFGFTYPLSKNLSARLSSTYSDSSSNMRYEKNYKYNYYTFNYFAGISWEL